MRNWKWANFGRKPKLAEIRPFGRKSFFRPYFGRKIYTFRPMYGRKKYVFLAERDCFWPKVLLLAERSTFGQKFSFGRKRSKCRNISAMLMFINFGQKAERTLFRSITTLNHESSGGRASQLPFWFWHTDLDGRPGQEGCTIKYFTENLQKVFQQRSISWSKPLYKSARA